MKVVRQSTSQFRGKLPRLRIGLASPFFAVMGLAVIYLSGQSVRIHCSRTGSGTVDALVRRSCAGIAISETRLQDVRGARLESNTNQHGKVLHRVVFTTPSGDFRMTRAFTSALTAHQNTVEAINAFLADPAKQSLARVEQPDWRGISVGATAIGLALLPLLVRREIWMDRETDQFTLRWTGLFNRTILEFPLSDIEQFQVRSSEGETGETGYEPGFLLRNGTFVALHHLAGRNRAQVQADIDQLESFLNSGARSTSRSHVSSNLRTQSHGKVCVVCGRDCSMEVRYEDPSGRCYHLACYEKRHGEHSS